MFVGWVWLKFSMRMRKGRSFKKRQKMPKANSMHKQCMWQLFSAVFRYRSYACTAIDLVSMVQLIRMAH